MATINKVALAGATGSMGAPILQALLEANYAVTVLTRRGSNNNFPSGVQVEEVDYSDVQGLTSVLKGHDALISTVSTASVSQQEKLVDAAIAAGVKRLVPSEFGSDISLPKLRQLPVYTQKVQMEEYIEKKCKGTQTTYTYIFNNAFFDWGLDHKFLMDIPGKKMELFDGGNTSFATTPLPFVAKGTVAVLQHPEETANRAVRLQGTSITQNKLLKIAQSIVGQDGWTVTEVDTAEREKQSYANMKKDPGNIFGWIVGFLQRAIFAPGYGGDYSNNNDNELLGLKEMSDKDIEELIRSRA